MTVRVKVGAGTVLFSSTETVPVCHDARDHGGGSGAIIGHRQILPPIAVEVADGHGRWTAAYSKVPRRLERPIPVTQQHRDSRSTEVGHRQILPPIAIEVPRRDP